MSDPTDMNTTPSFSGSDGFPSPASAPAQYPPASESPASTTTSPGAAALWGAPGSPSTTPRKSRRGLWITLGVIGALLLALVGGGAVFVSAELGAPGNAATQFCGDLKVQSYHAAYGMLSTRMRAQLSEGQFTQDARALDTAEAKVKTCGQAAGSGAYRYTLFGSAATIDLAITRNTMRQGAVSLTNVGGDWKIDALATSLLGVNLRTIQAVRDFCAALQRQDYAGTYALLDSALQGTYAQDAFTQLMQDHDGIDGTVSACGLVGIGAGNSDASAQVTASITRAKLGERDGTIALTANGGVWKISGVAQPLQGTDLGSVQTATQFCVDLAIGDFGSAYQNLTSTAFQAAVTQAQFNAFFQLSAGESYTGCNLDLTAFTISGTTASFTVKFEVQADTTGQKTDVPATMTFVLENGAWKVLRIETHS
jgi:hypothetical protein